MGGSPKKKAPKKKKKKKKKKIKKKIRCLHYFEGGVIELKTISPPEKKKKD